jgi:hypothetical protein
VNPFRCREAIHHRQGLLCSGRRANRPTDPAPVSGPNGPVGPVPEGREIRSGACERDPYRVR